MSIILPHTGADVPVFRANGVCYQRVQQGVGLTPTNTWEEFAANLDFKSYADCESCHNDLSTPATFPMSGENLVKLYDGEIESGGNPEDPIYRSYIITLNGTLGYTGPYSPYFTSIDTPEWDGFITRNQGQTASYYWLLNPYDSLRFPNTIIRPTISAQASGSGVWMNFTPSRGWEIRIQSGWVGVDPTYIQGWYFKRSGWSFTGTYTLDTTYQNRGVISPTTITVTPVIP